MDAQQPSSTQTSTNSSLMPTVLAAIGLLVAAVALGLILTSDSASINDVSALDATVDAQANQILELEEKVQAYEMQEDFSVAGAVEEAGYQAVFLVDGETYFGKLSDGDLPGQVKLTDIYYLQTGTYDQGGELETQTQIALAKLGNELHGPKDVMFISRDQMKFWENMKEDSQVVSAIRAYQAGG